jgi:uncharacterized protein
MDLLATEIRALGCLIEKQRTTPDAYPLTLNSLRLACNQSTNREPVVAYEESDVRDALRRLERRGFVRFASGAGSRAAKYRHLLAERLPMDDAEQGLMCVLMLRGDQTPGELKQRAERLHPFASLAEVQETLERLIARNLVARLQRRPGQKEERYVELLGADAEDEDAPGGLSAGERGPAESVAREADGSLAEERGTAESVAREIGGGLAEERGVAESVAREAGERVGGERGTAETVPRETAAGPPARDVEIERLSERVARLEGELEAIKAELGLGVGP